MKINILGWKSTGLRSPDIEVTLEQGHKVTPVSFIQMPNGTGKTTTLDMLRAALTGDAENWTPEKVLTYKNQDQSEGLFVLHLAYDDTALTFEIKFDFENGRASYRTTSPRIGGVKNGWNPPPDVRRFLNNRFVRLFIFDGEFPDKILKAGESDAENAIDALFQLYLLDEIAQKATADWERHAKQVGSKSHKAQEHALALIKTLKARKQAVENAKTKAVSRLEELSAELKELNSKIKKRAGSTQTNKKQLEEAHTLQEAAKVELANLLAQSIALMRQPHILHDSFGAALVELKDELDQLKLPANTSSQFFVELAEETECICGRPIDATAKKAILQRSHTYLADDISGVLNSLKHDIGLQVESPGSATPEKLSRILQQIEKQAVVVREYAQTIRVLIQAQIEEGDTQLAQWTKTHEDKQKEQATLALLLQEINRPPLDTDRVDDPDCHCLKYLVCTLEDEQQKLAKITKTVLLRSQTNIIRDITAKAVEKARATIKTSLTTDCNQRLRKVLPRSPLEIEGIGQHVSLRGQLDASMGQKLSIGYVFLTSLLGRGQNKFPLVLDSPAGSLDGEVREEVGKLVPTLCSQFVSFIISTEKQRFVDAVHKAADGEVKYLTCFKITKGTQELINRLPKKGVVKTANGVLVDGEEYFDKFDLKEQ